MQSLRLLPVENPEHLELAEIEGDYEGPVRRYVFSTAETRDIVNRPEVRGMEYTEKLEEGVTHLLRGFRPHRGHDIDERRVNVFVFLRGGLNFGLRNALHRAHGWNLHRTSFMSSQRAVDAEGRWFIREDSYRKITIAPGSVVYCGDVVATGVTLEHGLAELTRAVREYHGSIRHFTFFTIGCHKAEKILNHYAEVWRSTFPAFEGIDLFYVEGKFHLADSKTPVLIKLQGTDLLRRDSLLMPAFIKSQEEGLRYALERCTIYDAGSRAYDVHEYNADVREYWEQVAKLAEEGMTAERYLMERFPEASEALQKRARSTDLGDLSERRVAFFC